MAQAPSLTPMDPGQEETVTFDFGRALSPGVTITGDITITCTVAEDSTVCDPTPSSRIIGSASIGTSPWSGLAAQAVLQRFGNCVAGCLYVLQCTCMTSDGDTPSVWGHLPVDMPS